MYFGLASLFCILNHVQGQMGTRSKNPKKHTAALLFSLYVFVLWTTFGLITNYHACSALFCLVLLFLFFYEFCLVSLPCHCLKENWSSGNGYGIVYGYSIPVIMDMTLGDLETKRGNEWKKTLLVGEDKGRDRDRDRHLYWLGGDCCWLLVLLGRSKVVVFGLARGLEQW